MKVTILACICLLAVGCGGHGHGGSATPAVPAQEIQSYFPLEPGWWASYEVKCADPDFTPGPLRFECDIPDVLSITFTGKLLYCGVMCNLVISERLEYDSSIYAERDGMNSLYLFHDLVKITIAVGGDSVTLTSDIAYDRGLLVLTDVVDPLSHPSLNGDCLLKQTVSASYSWNHNLDTEDDYNRLILTEMSVTPQEDHMDGRETAHVTADRQAYYRDEIDYTFTEDYDCIYGFGVPFHEWPKLEEMLKLEAPVTLTLLDWGPHN